MGSWFAVLKQSAHPRYALLLHVGAEGRVGAEVSLAWTLDGAPTPNPADAVFGTESEELARALRAGPCLSETRERIVWDLGAVDVEGAEDVEHGLRRGKLRLTLRGHKLRGLWALGRGKGTPQGRGKPWRISKRWALTKTPDEHASPRGIAGVCAGSVLSGRNPGEGAPLPPASFAGAAKGRVPWQLEELPLILRPPAQCSGHVFQLCLRGHPVIAGKAKTRGRLVGASGPLEKRFPELALALEALPRPTIFIAEIISPLGEDRLRQRLTGRAPSLGAALDQGLRLQVRDVLSVDGRDVRRLPARERWHALATLVPAGGFWLPPMVVEEGAEGLLGAANQQGLDARVLGVPADSTFPPAACVVLEAALDQSPPARASKPDGVARTKPPLRVRTTNRDKVFYPEHGLTKGNLLDYYTHVSPFILPHLRDRPVVQERFPDGIYGKSFFLHHAPGAKSAWMKTVRVRMSRRPRDYFLVDSVDALIYLINLGTIPLLVWPSRFQSLEEPDWCVLDLDRGDAPWSAVVRAAERARELCELLQLPCYLKTSGGSGLHVVMPLAAKTSYAQSRLLCELLARTIETLEPELTTTELEIERRGTRVYLDCLVNVRGRMLVSAYSVRARPGATVSTPLSWDELSPDLDPTAFTIRTLPERLAERGEVWRDFGERRANLASTLALAAEKLDVLAS